MNCRLCGSEVVAFPVPALRREGAWLRKCHECLTWKEFVPTEQEISDRRKLLREYYKDVDDEVGL